MEYYVELEHEIVCLYYFRVYAKANSIFDSDNPYCTKICINFMHFISFNYYIAICLNVHIFIRIS